jgi:hypothetical protein
MNYEQFVRSQIVFHEQMLADIKAGKVFWCETCECWVPMDEKREDPWGGDWPVCIDCIADQGLDDNLLDAAEAEEEEQHLKDQGEQLQ